MFTEQQVFTIKQKHKASLQTKKIFKSFFSLKKTRMIAVQITPFNQKFLQSGFKGDSEVKLRFFLSFNGLPYGINKVTLEKKKKIGMVGPIDNGPSTNYRVVYLTGTA